MYIRLFCAAFAAFWLGLCSTGSAGMLDPLNFSSLGTLTISGGSYTFNTTTDTLTNSYGVTLFTGVTYNGIAVFDFSGITISGANIVATGTDPLALLSQGNILVSGSLIELDGGIGGDNNAGPGGYAGGDSQGVAGNGPGGGGGTAVAGGGGGFGGRGGDGNAAPNGSGSAAPGGLPYGNLANQLVGGSGGGGGVSFPGGGGGGGAIEVGATGSLTISGGSSVQAEGATGLGFGGGGSGGGIFLHAQAVNLAGSNVLDVSGGGSVSGGGGGGGQILILANSYTNTGTFNLSGGVNNNGTPGSVGVFMEGSLPEPSSLIMGGTALVGLGVVVIWRSRGAQCAAGSDGRR